MSNEEFNQQITALVEAWCDRRQLGALAELLPPWLSNNGLTDGWADLASALRGLANSGLPPDERETLKRLWIEVDMALRNR
jgi:hypothetical protein